MNWQRDRQIVRLGTALIVTIMALCYGSASAAFKNVEIGMKVPEVAGRDLVRGRSVSSQKMASGGAEAVVIVFWATWSPRSVQLLDDLKQMTADMADPRLQVLAVNVDGQMISRAGQAAITDLVGSLELPYPVILDADLVLFHTFGVIAVPSAAVLDREHVLRADPAGYSLVVRQALADSISVLLGHRIQQAAAVLRRGYRPQARAQRYYNKGVRLVARGMLEHALRDAEKAAAADTLFSSPHALRGRILLALGQPEEAVRSFGRAAELDSASVSAQAGWGRALFRLDRLPAAQLHLEQALALDPAYVPALLDLAACLDEQQDTAGAAARLQEALELNPRDPETLLRWGLHLRAVARTDEALAAYRTALEQLGHQ